jgi:phage-related protein
VAAVIAVVVLLWKKSETFRSIVLGVWAAVRAAAVATGNAVKAVWNAVWAVLRAGASAYIAYWRAIWTAARVTATAVANAVRATWNAVWGALRSGANGVASAVKAVWSGIATAARNAGSAVRGAFASAFGALRAAAGGLGSALAAPFNALRGAINSVIGAVQSLIGWLGRIHVPKISLPKIPGLGRSAAPAVSGVSAFAAGARSYGVAPRVTSPAARATSSGGGSVVINVNGALDPEAVARQIRRLLGAHGRRTGAGTALVFR